MVKPQWAAHQELDEGLTTQAHGVTLGDTEAILV